MGRRGEVSFAPLPLEGLLPSGALLCCVALRWQQNKNPLSLFPVGNTEGEHVVVVSHGVRPWGAIGGVGPLGAPPGFLGRLCE